MNVYEFAMKMELDGKTFYEEHAAKIENAQLKKILIELADDEQKHYNIFKAMYDGEKAQYQDSEKTTILTLVKNTFEQMKASDVEYTFPADARAIWEQAREIEKKAEQFYREKAVELPTKSEQEVFCKIAEEERRHWVTMENIIQFLDRPSTWLDNAEWSDLDDH